MDNILQQKLSNLPPLDNHVEQERAVSCKICGAIARLFDVVDLQKHCSTSDQYSFGLSGIPVRYHRCIKCGFLFTGFFDDWSTEEFARYIYNKDYVLVDPDYAGIRPTRLARMMSTLLDGRQSLRILDYGSGSGIFAAEMRKAGFIHTEGFDPFSSPTHPEGTFDLVTCFEALEHMAWPDREMAKMHAYLRPAGSLVFSQCVQPRDINRVRGAWWYLAPRNGHISLFTVETLLSLLPSPEHSLHSDGMLWVMAPSSTHPVLGNCLTALGPALMAVSLRPPHTGADESWHPAEAASTGLFRWSCTDMFQWRLATPQYLPAKLELRIPFSIEIEAGFATRCSVEIEGVSIGFTVSDQEILAEALINTRSPQITVTLRTPAPRSPFELRGAPDGRKLGLGMLVV